MSPARAVLWVAESLRADAPEKLDLPNFRAVEASGTRFRRCVMTFPARIQKDPVFWAVIPNLSIVTGTVLWDRRQTLAEVLCSRGRCVHVAAFPAYKTCDAGFHRSYFKNYPDLVLAYKCIEWIEEEDPILAVVHPQDLMNAGAEKEIRPGGLYEAGSAYRTWAAKQDEALGFFVSHLKRLKKWDDTLFILVGDHGLSHKGGHPPSDPETWFSPLVVKGPGVKKGASFDLAECVDVAPTVCRLLGSPAPRGATGRVLGEALESSGGEPTSGEPKLLRLQEMAIEFDRRIAASPLPEEKKAALKAEFLGYENYPKWAPFESMDALIAHNRSVLAKVP
ncbi:MAG: sulfatase-like hydrolase/transferase [Planctomycetota bacterium]